MRRHTAVSAASEVTTGEERAAAALQVLSGVPVTRVAAALAVEPELVSRWADLYAEGGEWRLSGRMDPRSFEARDRFLTLLAHEFRTPLTVIGGWVETLQSSDLPADTRSAALEVIARQIAHLERMAADALDAGAVARGQLHLELAQVEVRQLLREVVESMQLTGTHVEDGAAVTVRADPGRLGQITASLLGHARRLGASSPVGVAVAADASGRVEVTVTVEDRQIGFDEVASLFEPYDRPDTSIGTGLGLFLCRALVVAHGGEIGVRSEGSGTAFWYRIPVGGPSSETPPERTTT